MALEVLTRVDAIARELALDYFVIGAMARDILLYGVFGLDTGRRTQDDDPVRGVEDAVAEAEALIGQFKWV